MLEALGGKAEASANTLTVYGTGLIGGTVDSFHDHRIAMSLAVTALRLSEPITIKNRECVAKSYPSFFEDIEMLKQGVRE